MADRPEAPRLYARVAREISLMIEDGRYALGGRLPAERDLSQLHGVSRQTIREAVIALEIDGLVEVRMGSGIYVTARRRPSGNETATDIGPFELLEARRAIEGEVCAMAAVRITPAELVALEHLLGEMECPGDLERAENADRRFHQLIAKSTQNSAMVEVVDQLWAARARSPQTRFLSDKARDAGIAPGVQDHAQIVSALKSGDPQASRAAMARHLGQVLDALLAATEVHEMELVRARLATERRRYGGATLDEALSGADALERAPRSPQIPPTVPRIAS